MVESQSVHSHAYDDSWRLGVGQRLRGIVSTKYSKNRHEPMLALLLDSLAHIQRATRLGA